MEFVSKAVKEKNAYARGLRLEENEEKKYTKWTRDYQTKKAGRLFELLAIRFPDLD